MCDFGSIFFFVTLNITDGGKDGLWTSCWMLVERLSNSCEGDSQTTRSLTSGAMSDKRD
jgi:hypothetical protein